MLAAARTTRRSDVMEIILFTVVAQNNTDLFNARKTYTCVWVFGITKKGYPQPSYELHQQNTKLDRSSEDRSCGLQSLTILITGVETLQRVAHRGCSNSCGGA